MFHGDGGLWRRWAAAPPIDENARESAYGRLRQKLWAFEVVIPRGDILEIFHCREPLALTPPGFKSELELHG